MVCLGDHLVWLNYRMFRENISEEVAGQIPGFLLIIQVHLIPERICILEHFLKIMKAMGWGELVYKTNLWKSIPFYRQFFRINFFNCPMYSRQ